MSDVTNQKAVGETMLSRARELVTQLEQGNEDRVIELIGSLSTTCENSLSQRVHNLAGELHESLNGLTLDSRFAALTEDEMPDMRDRLDYVMVLTRKAAQRTLTAVEHGLPIVEELCSQAGRMKVLCDAMESDGSSTASLAPQARELRRSILLNAETLHGYLSDVLMAQSFQDLTGPIIRRVVGLVQEIEEKLSALIGRTPVREEGVTGCGPNPGSGRVPVADVGQSDYAQDQGDADDLLSKPGI